MTTTRTHAASAASRSTGHATRLLSPTGVRDLLLIALTVSSGAIDAISFLALGKVFTAFMTGNFVFLGLGVAGAAGGPDVVRALVALAAYPPGVYVAALIVRDSSRGGVWPRRVSMALGVTVVLQAVFLALWAAVSGQPGTGTGRVLTGLMAMSMGLQSGAIAALAVKGVFTTAATATVIYVMRDLAPESRSAAAERVLLVGVLTALFAGAAAGGLLLVHARTYAPVLPLIATILVIATAAIALPGRNGEKSPDRCEP